MFRFSRLNKKAETGVIELEMEDVSTPSSAFVRPLSDTNKIYRMNAHLVSGTLCKQGFSRIVKRCTLVASFIA